MSLAHDIEKTKRTADVYISENVDFTGMLLSEAVLEGLRSAGFKKPSPIQLKAIPLGLCGFDLIIQSKSGTGKTAVFAIIALQNFSYDLKNPQVLILTPTREIAVQIQRVLSTIGFKISGLVVNYFVGGLPIEQDKKALQQTKVNIIIGTPGRIRSLIETNHLVTKSIKLFVLDEADKLMLDSFKNDIEFIISKLPKNKQIIATSATYPDSLDNVIEGYMNSPIRINVETDIPTLLGLKQFVSIVQSHLNVARQMKIKTDELTRILSNIPFKQCIIFTNYQIRAESLSNNLNNMGWPSKYISASQTQKERLHVLKQLKNNQCRVLISTDLTARGIDVENVNLVVNYDVPYDSATYLHRIGRAGRYGSQGLCITICCHGEEYEKFKRLMLQISNKLNVSKLPSKDSNIPVNLWKCDDSLFEKVFEQANGLITHESQSSGGELKATEKSESIVETVDTDASTPPKENDATILCNHLNSPDKETSIIYEKSATSSRSSSEEIESGGETESDYGEPMLQDLSTTPEALAKQKEKELILKKNIALLQISKLLVNLTPLPTFEPFSYFKKCMLDRTGPETHDPKIENENFDPEPFMSFTEMNELVQNRTSKTELLAESEPQSQSQLSAIQFLTETKITEEIISATEYLLELVKQQRQEYRNSKLKYHQIPYKKLLNALVNRIPIVDILNTSTHKKSPQAKNSPELIKSKVMFDSKDPDTYTYEQYDDNKLRYSAKKKLYEMKDSKSKEPVVEKTKINDSTSKPKQKSENIEYQKNVYSETYSYDPSYYNYDSYYYQNYSNLDFSNCRHCNCHKCTCGCHYNNYNYNRQNSTIVVPKNATSNGLDPWYQMWMDQNQQIRNHIQQIMYIRNMSQYNTQNSN